MAQHYKLSSLLHKVVILGLFATVSGTAFISPLPSLVAVVCFPLVYAVRGRKIPKISFFGLLFFGVAMGSILLYDPKALTEFDFYRRDGNFIISFAPLLVFPFFCKDFYIQRLFGLFLLFASTLYLVLFAGYLTGNSVDFHGLFVAHNASGGFFSILCSLAFAFFWNKKSGWSLVLLVLGIVFLFASGSRGSMLGFVLAITFFLMWKSKMTSWIGVTLGAILLVQLCIVVSAYPKYETYGIAEGKSTIQELISEEYGSVSGRTANIYIRMYDNWPRGIHSFLKAPLLGTGFGSVNDVPFQFEGPPGFQYNTQPDKQYDSSHAHHTYFHILGEQGILGLGIFLLFLRAMYIFIRDNGHNKIVQEFLWISFFNLVVMSFTEHRFTSPSNVLPFTLSLSLYIMYVNYQKKYGQEHTA